MLMTARQWNHPGQAEHVEQVVREYPRQEGEMKLHYIVRIALEAGLIRDGDGIRRWPAESRPVAPEDVRGYRSPLPRELDE